MVADVRPIATVAAQSNSFYGAPRMPRGSIPFPCPPDRRERIWYLLHMESGADGAIAVRFRGDWEGLGASSPKISGQVSAFPRTGGESAGLLARCGMVDSRRLGAGVRR